MRQKLLISAIVLVVCGVAPLFAQERPLHHFHWGDLPPGTIGAGQLLRFPQLRGYFQPFQILAPEGARVSLHVDGRFEMPRPCPVLAGLQVGQVYQLKVSSIPFHEGMELYPSIEVINRLYPPAGRDVQFPVPVQLTQEELELALSGHFVTRVIYLEESQHALAVQDDALQQRFYEAPPGQDALQIADRLGRPLAILRMGSRIPDLDSAAHHPPVLRYPEQATATQSRSTGWTIEREARNYPRIPVRPAAAPGATAAGATRQP